eukprot:299332_1
MEQLELMLEQYYPYIVDLNPNKLKVMQYLIQIHEERGDKILVFCDSILLIKHCAELLHKPYIYGKTKNDERKIWLNKFNNTSNVNCLFMSSVGDTGINLPNVNVVIQISSHYGSRRQETQRLGRILRPKQTDENNKFNAYFYTLISTNTVDAKYSAQRQKFLIDQGYIFHTINAIDLLNPHNNHTKYWTHTQLLQFLNSNDNISDEDINDNKYSAKGFLSSNNNKNKNSNNKKRTFIETKMIDDSIHEPQTKIARISYDGMVSLTDNNNRLPIQLESKLQQTSSKKLIYIGKCNGLLFGNIQIQMYAKIGE